MGRSIPPMTRLPNTPVQVQSKYKTSTNRMFWLPVSGGVAALMAMFTFLFLREQGRPDWFAFGVIMVFMGLIITPLSFYISEESELKRLRVLEKLDR